MERLNVRSSREREDRREKAIAINVPIRDVRFYRESRVRVVCDVVEKR